MAAMDAESYARPVRYHMLATMRQLLRNALVIAAKGQRTAAAECVGAKKTEWPEKLKWRHRNPLWCSLSRKGRNMMVIKILGSGCKNCMMLADNVKAALSESGLVAQVEKVTDIQQIIPYGVMSMPAMVIDEKVVSFGKVLKPADISKILEKHAK